MPKTAKQLTPLLTLFEVSSGAYSLRLSEVSKRATFLSIEVAKLLTDARTLEVITPSDMKVFDFTEAETRLPESPRKIVAGLKLKRRNPRIAPASATLITYNVNLNFNPTRQEAPPGAGSVGTITGTFTIDTSIPIQDSLIPGLTNYQPTDVTAVDLVESTNNGQANIGGAFGSPNYTSFTFNETGPGTHIFFGSPIVFQLTTAAISEANYKFGGLPYIFLTFQTNDSYFDGSLIEPTIQFGEIDSRAHADQIRVGGYSAWYCQTSYQDRVSSRRQQSGNHPGDVRRYRTERLAARGRR